METCKNCDSLKLIKLPKNLIEIESRAFANCRNLQSIIFPNKLVSIGMEAFTGCLSLQSVRIPDTVMHMSDVVFEHNTINDKPLTIKCDPNSYAAKWANKHCFPVQGPSSLSVFLEHSHASKDSAHHEL